MTFDPSDPAGADLRHAVSCALTSFLDGQESVLASIGTELTPVLQAARDYTAGGKRLRPAFCYWGYVAAAGQPRDPQALMQAAASLELLHVSALVHDDIMDHSDTRRGLPSAHRRFEAAHRHNHGMGAPEEYGRDVALLLGDLLTVWSAEMFTTAALPTSAMTAAAPILAAVRTEVNCGQVLDVTAQAGMAGTTSESMLDLVGRVVEYKSASYTVVRPAQLGVALSTTKESPTVLLTALQQFGSPLGRAFQYRDDLLGVFGDEQVTGKPAGDDLREGKRTVLVAHALSQATPDDAATLTAMLGRADLEDDDVHTARRIIEQCGARAAVEETIHTDLTRALAVLDATDMTDEGRAGLRALARAAVDRAA